MKSIQNISTKLERQLIRAFAMLDTWFDADDADNSHVRDLLESIIHQNQRLLSRLPDESLAGSEYLPRDAGYGLPPAPCDCIVGDASDVYNVSRGHRREHNGKGMADLRRELRSQLERCLDQLDALRRREEHFAAVASLMNLDIYRYIQCIMQITRRGYEGISEGGACPQ